MSLPESIRRAWTETEYRVRLRYGGHATILCGMPLPMPLLALLSHADESWGYITAWNPAGILQPLATNKARQRRLRDGLRAKHLGCFGGIGIGASDWREPSLFVPGMSYAQIDEMARQFGQLGVVRGTGAGPAELHELI